MIYENMENYAKRRSEVFCSGHTIILGSESHVLLPMSQIILMLGVRMK